MRRVAGYPLWIGHAGDARTLPRLLELGIEAVVDLAWNEPPAVLSRELVYCRFPLADGAGNPAWRLRGAVATVAGFLGHRVPTLVACGAGMSRAPAVAGAALAAATGRPAEVCLADVLAGGYGDVSGELWRALRDLGGPSAGP